VELGDLLPNVDLAIGTYRRAVGTTIPELTRIAWREKRDEIERRTPAVTERSFVYVLSRADYEREFGSDYRKPGVFTRIVAFVLKVLPKIGPMRPLAFEPLTPEAEALFARSIETARVRYRASLRSLRAGRLRLSNTDFDTGDLPTIGVNRLADKTYADLLHRLARRGFVDMSPELGRELSAFFGGASPSAGGLSRRRAATVERELQALNSRMDELSRRSASAYRLRAGSP
jgi:hypothetical protein